MPLPSSYQPWLLFRLAAQNTAKRVLNTNDSHAYQRFAGLLSCVVLVVPAIALYVLLRQLSDWPHVFDAIVLYVCLDVGAIPAQLQSVALSLQKGQLSLARQQLQPLVLRDTHTLSDVGVVKAALDTLILRFASHWLAVICVYGLFGAPAAMLLRILFELHWQWNPKLQSYRWFGVWVRQALLVITLLPLLVFTLVLALQVGLRRTVQFAQQAHDHSWPLPQRYLLAAWAQTLQRQTGGPAMYQQQKLRRARIGPAEQPSVDSVAVGLKAIATQQTAFWLIGMVMLLLHFG